MASSGCCGVDSSLNISILPLRIIMKSVNVPPVSTPILEIDLRDILDESRNDGLDLLDRSLRVALPRERLNVRPNRIETVDGDFAHPGEILIGGRMGRNVFDPLQYLLTLLSVRTDLQDRSLARVDAQF